MDTFEKILWICFFASWGLYFLICIVEFISDEIDNYHLMHIFDDGKKKKK